MPSIRIVPTSNTAIVFSAFLHALILFGILSALFILVISKIEENLFKQEITSNIQNTLPQALKNADKDGRLKKILQNLPLSRLAAIYSQPDQATQTYNAWLKRTMIFFIVAVALMLGISALFLYFTCGHVIPLFSILIENVIIFSLVGMFEAVFFLKIASKYIPVPPSLLTERLYSDLKNWE